MIKDIIERFIRFNRGVILETTRGEYIYDDEAGRYKPLYPELNRSVSNIESFTEAVIEEANQRLNVDCNFMTVILNEKGGVYYPDDKKRLDQWNFNRRHSQQFDYLSRNLEVEFDHLSLLRVIQGLKPSLGNNYVEIYRAFKQINVERKANVLSAPIYDDDGGGSGEYKWNVELEQGGNQVGNKVPSGFKLTMPIAKAGKQHYDIDVELMVNFEEREGRGRLRFALVAPNIDTVYEQSIAD